VEQVNEETNIKVNNNLTQAKVENSKRKEEITQKNLLTRFGPN